MSYSTLPPHTWARPRSTFSRFICAHLTPTYVGSTRHNVAHALSQAPYPHIRGLDTKILWLLRGRTTPVVPFAIMIMALGRRLALKEIRIW